MKRKIFAFFCKGYGKMYDQFKSVPVRLELTGLDGDKDAHHQVYTRGPMKIEQTFLVGRETEMDHGDGKKYKVGDSYAR